MVAPIGKTGGVTNHTKMLLKEYNKLNKKIIVFNISPEKDHKYLGSIIKLYRRTIHLFLHLILNGNDYDIIHIQASGPMGGFLPAIVSSFTRQFSKSRLVITFHHGNAEEFIRNHRQLFHYVLKKTDLMILVSQDQKRIIQEAYDDTPLNKIRVIGNGFDDDITGKCARHAEPTGNKRTVELINVGNLLPVKGQDILIKAITIIFHERGRKDIRCRIFGDGTEKAKLEALIKENGLQNIVTMMGWQPHEEIMKQLSNSDIFLMPSLKEGSPLVLFEALGCGLPVIASNVGGIPEIINDKRYGLLVSPENPEELAMAIESAASISWNRDEIREYALRFSWKNIARTTFAEYEDLFKS
jgi:glycosyltransferase involved in cell wall biosynthesis